MKKGSFRIALYGDSLALPRKDVVSYQERYFYIIQKHLKEQNFAEVWEVKDRAKGAIVISEIVEQYNHDNGYFDLPGDIIIIHSGVVDCAPRPINQQVRGKISKLPSMIKKIVVNYIHKNRSKILQGGKSYVRTEPDVFFKQMTDLVTDASLNYNRVYVINICPTNKQTEAHSPGFTTNIDKYNRLIAKIVEESKNSNVHLIDINKFIMERFDNIDEYVLKVDGHHITPLTNSVIADQILRIENAS